MTQNPLDSTRSRTAIHRLNAIHSMYKHVISNDDMLYVLSVFILEPARWMARIEWRPLTEEECHAMLVTWTTIGTRMGIQGIPETWEDYERWNIDYERKHMKYATSNTLIANATLDLFLSLIPSFLRSFGRRVGYCLMDARLRSAMGFPDPNATLQTAVETMLYARKMVIRYGCLPRLRSMRRTPASSTSNGPPTSLCPRYHIYEPTYANGYHTDKLGPAPPGKLMTTCPRWQ